MNKSQPTFPPLFFEFFCSCSGAVALPVWNSANCPKSWLTRLLPFYGACKPPPTASFSCAARIPAENTPDPSASSFGCAQDGKRLLGRCISRKASQKPNHSPAAALPRPRLLRLRSGADTPTCLTSKPGCTTVPDESTGGLSPNIPVRVRARSCASPSIRTETRSPSPSSTACTLSQCLNGLAEAFFKRYSR